MPFTELTHAAFPSPRPWISDGPAHLRKPCFGTAGRTKGERLELTDLHRAALQMGKKWPPTQTDESLLNTSTEEFYRSKAMYVWWMLRDVVGEESLKKALAAYRPEQDKDPSYMQHLLQTQSKKDLQWFFDDWVYHDRGLPDFRIESAFSRAPSNGVQLVIVSIENLGNAGAEVPVTLRMKEGSITKRLEVRGQSKVTFRMEAISMPEEIVVNDSSVPESTLSNNAYKIETLPH